MNIIPSSPSSSAKFNIFSSSQYPNSSKFHFIIPLKTPHSHTSNRILPHIHSHESPSSSPPVVQEKPQNPDSKHEGIEMEDEDAFEEEIKKAKKSFEELLVIRRPEMEFSDEKTEKGENLKDLEVSSGIDEGLSRFAKKMPIFESERVESGSEERPLLLNLDLAYKAKILTAKFQYEEAEEILFKCIKYWPEEGRPYVALGKSLRPELYMKRDAKLHKEKMLTFGT